MLIILVLFPYFQFSYFLATKIYSLNLYHYCPALFSEILSVHHTMSHIRQHHDNVTVCIQTICREKFHAEYIGHKLSQHWWDYSVADNGSWKHMKNSHTVISAQLQACVQLQHFLVQKATTMPRHALNKLQLKTRQEQAAIYVTVKYSPSRCDT